MIAYREFVRLNLPHYVRAGFQPTGAMRMVARDWQHWKTGTARNYVYYLVTKTGVKRLVRTKPKKKNPEGLFEAFHGSPPARIRRVFYEPPKKGEPLIKIGRLVEVEYTPEYPSQRTGVRFYHEMGHTGTRILKSNAILATNKEGTQLYILRDKDTKYPKFTPRGIIG